MNAHSTGSPNPERWRQQWIDKRRLRENERNHHFSRAGIRDGLHMPLQYRFLRLALKATGLFERGYRNYADIQLTRVEHSISDWPQSLDGFRILHFSDLHIDLDRAILPAIRQRLNGLEFEMAVITGDFVECARSGHEAAQVDIRQILDDIGEPSFGRFGVLGNHDSIELAASLEAMDLPVLVNEARVLGDGPSTFALAGVDDAYYFKSHDLSAARTECPDSIPRILLSHSPQIAAETEGAGFSLMLSGHTHGGQICLPGGHAIASMPEIPPNLFRGSWRHGSLTGYTSTGSGACHLPVRFNCPPEIVLHTLRRAVRLT